MSGYKECDCRDCMNLTCGASLCSDCTEAGCEAHAEQECAAAGAYFDDTITEGCLPEGWK